MSDLKLTAEEVAWVKAYVEARRTDASFCNDAAAKANAAARLAPAEPVAPPEYDPASVAFPPGFVPPTTRTIEGDAVKRGEVVYRNRIVGTPESAVQACVTLDGCRVSMQVLAMDEGLRPKQEPLVKPIDHDREFELFRVGELRLMSRWGPALLSDGVWLRGWQRERDNDVAQRQLSLADATAARAYFDSVCGLLTAFNTSRASTPPSASPTLLEAARAVIDKSWYAHGAVGGSHWAYSSDTRNAFKAAIARETNGG